MPGRKLIKRYFVVWLVAGAGWYYLHSALHAVAGDSVGLAALLQNLPIIPESLGKFFVPARFQLTPLFSLADTTIGVIAGALFAWVIIRIGGRANRRIQFGLLWALLCILPVMVFRNADAQYIFDYLYHRAYLPSIGVIIVLAESIGQRLGGFGGSRHRATPQSKLCRCLSKQWRGQKCTQAFSRSASRFQPGS